MNSGGKKHGYQYHHRKLVKSEKRVVVRCMHAIESFLTKTHRDILPSMVKMPSAKLVMIKVKYARYKTVRF